MLEMFHMPQMLLMLEWCLYKANSSGERKHFLPNLLGVSQVLPSAVLEG